MLVVDLYQPYNTVTSWPALAASADGTYLKYTDGTGQAKTPADDYAGHCVTQKIPYGGYAYAEPGDPAAQADALVAEYVRLGGVLAPALDLESGGIPTSDRTAFAKTFLQRVHQTYPVVALYSSTSWLHALQPDTWGFPWLRTWAAEYGSNNGDRQAVQHYSGTVHLHQYTSAGTLPGISGQVDLDYAETLAPLQLTSMPSASSARKSDDEETQMQPLRLAPAQNSTDVILIWDGRAAVLNAIAEAPGADDFIGKALCWGPNGGTGGGTPTNAAVPPVPGGWRVTANLPVALTIPAGTTRIVFSYSCGGYSQIQVVPT